MIILNPARRNSFKKMSIYSGSFGQLKASPTPSNDINAPTEDLQSVRPENPFDMIDIEDLIHENEKIRWVPNDAYEN